MHGTDPIIDRMLWRPVIARPRRLSGDATQLDARTTLRVARGGSEIGLYCALSLPRLSWSGHNMLRVGSPGLGCDTWVWTTPWFRPMIRTKWRLG